MNTSVACVENDQFGGIPDLSGIDSVCDSFHCTGGGYHNPSSNALLGFLAGGCAAFLGVFMRWRMKRMEEKEKKKEKKKEEEEASDSNSCSG